MISNIGRGRRRYQPYVFTEQGVAILEAIRPGVAWAEPADSLAQFHAIRPLPAPGGPGYGLGMQVRDPRLVLMAVVAILAFAALPAGAMAASTIHVVERATTDAVTNGSKQDKVGNVLTWHNKIYDAANKQLVGRDAGYCVRIVVGKSWECSWTNYLEAGSISVQGPFSDKGSTELAITGGTGAYAGARGTMTLNYRNKTGTVLDFIFHLI